MGLTTQIYYFLKISHTLGPLLSIGFCLFYPKSLSRRAEKKEPGAGFSGGNPCTDKNPSTIRSPPPAHTIFHTIAAFPDVPQPRTAHAHPHTSTSKYANLPPQKNPLQRTRSGRHHRRRSTSQGKSVQTTPRLRSKLSSDCRAAPSVGVILGGAAGNPVLRGRLCTRPACGKEVQPEAEIRAFGPGQREG